MTKNNEFFDVVKLHYINPTRTDLLIRLGKVAVIQNLGPLRDLRLALETSSFIHGGNSAKLNV